MASSRGVIAAGATLIVALVGLNVWQWSTRPSTGKRRPQPPCEAENKGVPSETGLAKTLKYLQEQDLIKHGAVVFYLL